MKQVQVTICEETNHNFEVKDEHIEKVKTLFESCSNYSICADEILEELESLSESYETESCDYVDSTYLED